MSIALSMLSLLLWAGLAIFLRKKALKTSFCNLYWPVLLIRVSMALSMAYLYKVHLGGGDTWQYFVESKRLMQLLWSEPSIWFKTLFGNNVLDQDYLVFTNNPRALFFSVFTMPFSLIGAGQYYLTNIWIALFVHSIVWWSVGQVSKANKILSQSMLLSWLLWPGVLCWASGIFKESLCLAALSLIVVVAMRWHIGKIKVKDFIILMLAIIPLWALKYYFAAVLLPLFLTYFIVIKINTTAFIATHRALIVTAFFGILAVLVLGVTMLHYNLRIERIVNVVYENFELSKRISQPGRYADYIGFEPTVWSIIQFSPDAIFTVLFRPMAWEVWNLATAIVAVENILLIILFSVTINHMPKVGKGWFLLFVVIIYVFATATMVGLSTPNFGTMHRYRALIIPFWLSWQFYFLIKIAPNSYFVRRFE
ncbi:MAG: hypothetical protein ACFCUU_06835 [Cyclobacteriaceae bacterium]